MKEEAKFEQPQCQFKDYFEEHVPFKLDGPDESVKHEYTVEITRAMFTQETFEVFKKYEAHVHGKSKSDTEDKAGYENFLCQSPLYDPTCAEDRALPHFIDDHMDDNRTLKNEGVMPKATGSYHMIHRIDG